MQKENKMGVLPINKLIINMSLPIVISMLVQALYNIVDSVYVGMINEQSLTAVSLAFPIQNLMIGVASGTAVGVNALASKALGEKNKRLAGEVAENGVFLAVIGYAIFLLIGIFGSRLFFQSQTEVQYIIDRGTEYISIICICSFGIFGEIMFERLLQSTGKTIFTMISQGVGAIINIILDPVFIFALDMGVSGAAVATVIGQIAACIIAFVFNKKKNEDIELHMKSFKPNGGIIKRICAIGIPSVIMVAIGSVMTFCMNKILIAFTKGAETAATVFGVYFKLNSFIFMPVFGLNNAVVPIVAFNYGARNRRRMVKAIKLAVIYATALMFIGIALFMLIPDVLLKFFSASDEMVKIGVPALRVISTSFAFAGTCIALGSVFQALGRGIYSTITSFVRQLVVLIPAAYVLARIGQNIGNYDLVWYSYPIAEVFSLATTLICFVRIYKQIIKPIPLDGDPDQSGERLESKV